MCLFLQNVRIWNTLLITFSILLFEVSGAELWGCETGRGGRGIQHHPQDCMFGDLSAKVEHTKPGYGRFFSSNHNAPQQDYAYHDGGGGYGRPSYGHMIRKKVMWDRYEPKRMPYRPMMKRMYTYPVRQHHYGWKPRHQGYGQPKHYHPMKKKKKEISVQIIVHCPSEHPLCKSSYGKPKKRYSYGKRRYHGYGHGHGHGHGRGYGKQSHGWERKSYGHQRRYGGYERKGKWDEKKWKESYYDHDPDEEKYCDCKDDHEYYHDYSGHKVRRQVMYDRDNHESEQYQDNSNIKYVFNDVGKGSTWSTSSGPHPVDPLQRSNRKEYQRKILENQDESQQNFMDYEHSNFHEPQGTFLVVEATPPPPPSFGSNIISALKNQFAIRHSGSEKSLPIAVAKPLAAQESAGDKDVVEKQLETGDSSEPNVDSKNVQEDKEQQVEEGTQVQNK